MGQRILVTGAAGLIGQECVTMLLAAGHEVRALDLRAAEMAPRERLELVEGDILDAVARKNALKGVGGVVHLAAVSRVQDAEENQKLAWETNVVGTDNLLKDAQELAEGPPWFVHGSSREVYGEPQKVPVPETARKLAKNQYGRTKALAEVEVERYGRATRVPVVLLRFSNVYGSVHDRPKRVIPIFATRAIAGQPLEVHDGTKTFDFVHVSDAGRAVMACLNWGRAGGLKGEALTVNIATGVGTTLASLAAMTVKAAGSSSEVVETPPRDFDVRHFVGDPSLAKRALGFSCTVPLEDGLRRTVEAYRSAIAGMMKGMAR